MNKRTNYQNAPQDIAGALESATRIVDDFLPTPEELIHKEEKERITIALDKKSLDLFRDYAKKHDAKYQNMINGVIESYAATHLKIK